MNFKKEINKFKKILARKESQNMIRHLKSGAEILQSMRNATEVGGAFSKVLAGVSTLGIVLDTFVNVGFDGVEIFVESLGYEIFRFNTGGFNSDKYLYDILMQTTIPKVESLISEEKETLIEWDIGIAATVSADNTYVVLYKKTGMPLKDVFEKAKEIIREIVWSKNNSLLLTAINKKSYDLSTFGTVPLRVTEEYVGKVSPSEIADRIKKYNEPRCILIFGPSGIGKSTLAQKIAMAAKTNGRMLKITSDVMLSPNRMMVPEIIDIYQPSVLLIDDVQSFIDSQNIVLPILDKFKNNSADTLIILTYMVQDDKEVVNANGELIPGSLYFPGLRPGRIDEILVLELPDNEERKTILSCYMKEELISEEIIKETNGMSGAYLKEFAKRINAHGIEFWRKEVIVLKAHMPVKKTEIEAITEEDNDDNEEDEDFEDDELDENGEMVWPED